MDAILSLVVLSAIALAGGAALLWRRGNRQQAALMLLLAAVMVVNVLIWTLPDAGGTTPLNRAAGAGAS